MEERTSGLFFAVLRCMCFVSFRLVEMRILSTSYSFGKEYQLRRVFFGGVSFNIHLLINKLSPHMQKFSRQLNCCLLCWH